MSEQFEPHAEMPPEPMLSEAETRRLVERLEAQIKETEQLERAIATRPQPSAEPVDDLIERLRAFEGSDALGNGDFTVCQEAAARIEALEAENKRLRGSTIRNFRKVEG